MDSKVLSLLQLITICKGYCKAVNESVSTSIMFSIY